MTRPLEIAAILLLALRVWWHCPDCGSRLGAPHSEGCF